MDGGRVLRSIFARKMSYVKATHSAASIGKFISILMVIFGIYDRDIWLLLLLFIFMAEHLTRIDTFKLGSSKQCLFKNIMTKNMNFVLIS